VRFVVEFRDKQNKIIIGTFNYTLFSVEEMKRNILHDVTLSPAVSSERLRNGPRRLVNTGKKISRIIIS